MIQINDDWRIDSDALNWILQKRRLPKEGVPDREATWSNEGYFPTLPAALEALTERAIKIPEDVQAIQAQLDELHRIIRDKFAVLNVLPRDTAEKRVQPAQSLESEEPKRAYLKKTVTEYHIAYLRNMILGTKGRGKACKLYLNTLRIL